MSVLVILKPFALILVFDLTLLAVTVTPSLSIVVTPSYISLGCGVHWEDNSPSSTTKSAKYEYAIVPLVSDPLLSNLITALLVVEPTVIVLEKLCHFPVWVPDVTQLYALS